MSRATKIIIAGIAISLICVIITGYNYISMLEAVARVY